MIAVCKKCNHSWNVRIKTKPKECPHCKCRNWEQIPRISRCALCGKDFENIRKYCKECGIQHREEYYKTHSEEYYSRPEVKERRRNYMIGWEAQNKEKREVYWKKHYSKVEVKKRKKGNMDRWRKENVAHEKEYRRHQGKINVEKYNHTFKGKINSRIQVQKRLAMLRCVIHAFTKKEWIARLNDTRGFCPGCKVFIGIEKLELDHIYPLSTAYDDYLKTGVKRVYKIDDVQPLCKSCNVIKGKKIINFITL